MQMGSRADKALGYGQLTSLSSAKGFGDVTGGIPAGTKLVIVAAETQAVRWRDDGSNPTSTVGMPLATGQYAEFTESQLSQVKFIEQTASAKLNVTFYG